MQIEEKVTFEVGANGLPFIPVDSAIKIFVSVAESDEGGQCHIDIAGNQAALRKLGEICIALSTTQNYQIHIDADDQCSPINIRPNNIHMTLTNLDTFTPTSTGTKIRPPDWASGE